MHATTPKFTAKYKAWLESLSPEMLEMTPVAKADLEKMRAEEAAAKQAEGKE
jgi:hypothetical protein